MLGQRRKDRLLEAVSVLDAAGVVRGVGSRGGLAMTAACRKREQKCKSTQSYNRATSSALIKMDRPWTSFWKISD